MLCAVLSDRGTNFVGACKELKIPSNIDKSTVKTYRSGQSCSWIFNPPHASHFGGMWERMIGLARRILDSMFLQLKDKLTHEVLVTFMAEVAAIINGRPLVPVTTDSKDSFILTPAALLIQKVNVFSAPAGDFGVSRSSTCPTPSGTGGESNSSQHYRHAKSGSLFSRTSTQEVLFSSRTAKYQEMNGLLDW